ncbi:MAG: rusticyanin [Thermoplasmata archaeon]
MNKYMIFGIISIIILLSVMVFSAFYYYGGYAAYNKYKYLTQAQLDSLDIKGSGIYISQANSTIYVNRSSNLPVMAGPINAPSMYSFEILGLFNPTIVIMNGVTVHFKVFNIDTDSYHNFVLTEQGPPYPYMIGMESMKSGGYGFMSMMNFLPPTSSGHFYYYNFSYTFYQPGTYWYICIYPGHAENGMYGEIIVKQ